MKNKQQQDSKTLATKNITEKQAQIFSALLIQNRDSAKLQKISNCSYLESINILNELTTTTPKETAPTEGKKEDGLEAENKRLLATNKELIDALQTLLNSYRADFTIITGGKLNDTESVLKAKAALSNAHYSY